MFTGEQTIDRPQEETLGFWTAFIGPAVGLVGSLFNKQGNGEARGLAAITSVGNQLMTQLAQLESDLSAGKVLPADARNEAQAIASAFSDPTKFYQAKKGNDAAKLQQFKTDSQNLAARIDAVATQIEASALRGNGKAGGAQALDVAGFDSNLLTYAAIGLGAYLLLSRK